MYNISIPKRKAIFSNIQERSPEADAFLFSKAALCKSSGQEIFSLKTSEKADFLMRISQQ